MSIKLLDTKPWAVISKAAQDHRGRAQVAVAYFGKGAARLCPLKKGSILVVDASERTVKQGATHPNDLLSLRKNGVRIFSLSDLHAKVFVFGKRAFIGSANASNPSANRLVEVVVQTSDLATVQGAREFVADHCKRELGPESLKRLQKLYRPPRFPAAQTARRSANRGGGTAAQLPVLRLVNLVIEPWPEEAFAASQSAREKLLAKRRLRQSHFVECFWTQNPRICRGESVVQITTEPDGRVLVSPPGEVIGVRKWSNGRQKCRFVYVEVPHRRRLSFKALSRRLGRGARRRLNRQGTVNQAFADKLRGVWN